MHAVCSATWVPLLLEVRSGEGCKSMVLRGERVSLRSRGDSPAREPLREPATMPCRWPVEAGTRAMPPLLMELRASSYAHRSWSSALSATLGTSRVRQLKARGMHACSTQIREHTMNEHMVAGLCLTRRPHQG